VTLARPVTTNDKQCFPLFSFFPFPFLHKRLLQTAIPLPFCKERGEIGVDGPAQRLLRLR
jgi:hypothetical protein